MTERAIWLGVFAAVLGCVEEPITGGADHDVHQHEAASSLAPADEAALEGVGPVTDLSVVDLEEPGKKLIFFRALGRDFVIRAEPNWQLISGSAAIERGDQVAAAAEVGVVPPLIGEVDGEPDSWVRLRTRGESVEGLVSIGGRLLE